MVALHNTEAIYAAAMREAETTHSASTREAEATCATAVREAEAARAAQTSKLWQTNLETMWALEDEDLKGERHSHQSFLLACEVALQACPHKALGILMYPIHLLTGNMSLTSLLMATPQLTISSRDPISSPSHTRLQVHSTYLSVIVPFLLVGFCCQLSLSLWKGGHQSISNSSHILIHTFGGGLSCWASALLKVGK